MVDHIRKKVFVITGASSGLGKVAARHLSTQCATVLLGARRKVEEWDRTIDVNFKGVLYGIAAALPYMKQQKAGHIINVSSVYGHKVAPDAAVYCATKFVVGHCPRAFARR